MVFPRVEERGPALTGSLRSPLPSPVSSASSPQECGSFITGTSRAVEAHVLGAQQFAFAFAHNPNEFVVVDCRSEAERQGGEILYSIQPTVPDEELRKYVQKLIRTEDRGLCTPTTKRYLLPTSSSRKSGHSTVTPSVNTSASTSPETLAATSFQDEEALSPSQSLHWSTFTPEKCAKSLPVASPLWGVSPIIASTGSTLLAQVGRAHDVNSSRSSDGTSLGVHRTLCKVDVSQNANVSSDKDEDSIDSLFRSYDGKLLIRQREFCPVVLVCGMTMEQIHDELYQHAENFLDAELLCGELGENLSVLGIEDAPLESAVPTVLKAGSLGLPKSLATMLYLADRLQHENLADNVCVLSSRMDDFVMQYPEIVQGPVHEGLQMPQSFLRNKSAPVGICKSKRGDSAAGMLQRYGSPAQTKGTSVLGRYARYQKDAEALPSKEDVWKFSHVRLFRNLTLKYECDAPTEVVPYMYLGSMQNAGQRQQLRDLSIGYIVNVSRECRNMLAAGDLAGRASVKRFRYYNCPIFDSGEENIVCFIKPFLDFVRQARENDSRVLVHCFMGMSRSACLVMAYLVTYYELTLREALLYLISKRSIVSPNDGFLLQLMEYYHDFSLKNHSLEQLQKEAVGFSIALQRRRDPAH